MKLNAPDPTGTWKIGVLLLLALVGVLMYSRHMRNLELLALQQQLASTQNALAAANAEVERAYKAELPIVVSYRHDAANHRLAVVFSSSLPRSLEFVAMFSSPRTIQRKRFNLTVPANGTIAIGESEGWVLQPGHRIILSNQGFRPAEYVVPNDSPPTLGVN